MYKFNDAIPEQELPDGDDLIDEDEVDSDDEDEIIPEEEDDIEDDAIDE